MPTESLKSRYTLGIMLKITNLIVFSAYSMLFSILPKSLGTFHVMFLMLLFGFAICCLIIVLQGIRLGTVNYRFYVYRAAFDVLGLYFWFESLKGIGIVEATAISYMTPIFTILLSVPFLGEMLNVSYIAAVLISFVGVYIAIHPNFNHLDIGGSIFAILSSVMWASSGILCKKQTRTEHYMLQTFYTMFFSVIMLFAIVVRDLDGFHSMLDDRGMAYNLSVIILIGALAVLNNSVLFLAYKAAPISVLSPFSYLRLVIVGILNYCIFGKVPELSTCYGATVICLASLFIFYGQHIGKFVVTERELGSKR